MKNVFFKPWVGAEYYNSKPKILVIGDSHYCYVEDEDGNSIPACCGKCGVRGHTSYEDMKNDTSRHPDCPNFTTDDQSFTQGVMDCFIENLRAHSPSAYEITSFLRFSNKLLGIDISDAQYYEKSIEFWNHLAFYNYVQTASAKSKSATEYKANDRSLSSPLADEVVEELQPDYVIVWGSRAFGKWCPKQGYEDHNNGSMTFTLNSGKVVKAIRIDHPSRGFKQKDFKLFSSIIRNDYSILYLMNL